MFTDRRARRADRLSRRNKSNLQTRFERLEERTLMSITPIGGKLPPASKFDLAQAVNLQSTPVQKITASLANASDVDLFRISLAQGEFLALDVDPGILTGVSNSSLTIFDANHNAIATAGASLEPDTGVVSNNAAMGFRAPTAGTYFVQVGTTATNGGLYDLSMQAAALATGMQSANQLQKTGTMSVFLNGDVLDFAGPTGYGFGIRGAWTEKVAAVKGKTNLTSATFSASGAIYLQTAFGEVQLAVPDGKTFTVTTKNNTWNGAIGEVSTVSANIGLPLGNFAADLRQTLGLTMDSISLGSNWTIQLGSQVNSSRGISQLLNGVPYLVYGAGGAFHSSFGGVEITNKAADAAVIAADPTDPMLYIRASQFEFAGSLNGHIAYKPTNTSVIPIDPLYGHVYFSKGTTATQTKTDPKTGKPKTEDLPISWDGAITMNLDANHDGLWAGGQENASQIYQNGSVDFDAIGNVLADLDIGLNGSANAKFSLGKYNYTVPLGTASAVYQGPEELLWFKGGSVDPWKGTVMENFQMLSTATIEGYVWGKAPAADSASTVVTKTPGQAHVSPYFLQATSTYSIFGQKATMSVTVDDTRIVADAKVRALGVTTDVTGTIEYNGDFSLAGSADVKFAGLSGHADFLVAKQGSTQTFKADLSGNASYSASGVTASVSIDADLDISYTSSGKISYSGTIKATAKLKTAVSSTSVGVDASISGGNQIVLSIPKIGTKKIALPTT